MEAKKTILPKINKREQRQQRVMGLMTKVRTGHSVGRSRNITIDIIEQVTRRTTGAL